MSAHSTSEGKQAEAPVRSRAFPDPVWPTEKPCRVIFLVDAASRAERRIAEAWIKANKPEHCAGPREPDVVPIPCSRRPRKQKIDPRLAFAVASQDDPLMAPLRVVWFPQTREMGRQVRFRDIPFGNPRDPNFIRQAWILWRRPELCRLVAGEPARLSALRERWAEQAHQSDSSFRQFVAQQAALALERAERNVRGARYKVPKMIDTFILGSAAFRARAHTLSRELGRPSKRVRAQAARYLKEIAAKHSPFLMDLAARLIRRLYTLGYEERIRFDRDHLDRIFALGQQYPLVFLPSHKSNLDHLMLQYLFYRLGQSPNHTAGGINLNFFPIGPLVRRCGVLFIRRTFRDNEVYKFVLRSYLDYLIEKRFHLEWYLEGGRSRTGKLQPPRFGLLNYVIDSYRRGKSEDIYFVPVSITYDQISDVGSYVAEQKGGAKERESFGWFVRTVRSLRRRYGRIHVRFHDPVSLREFLGPPEAIGAPEGNLEVQKFAFRLEYRINAVTPITPVSLVTLALLGAGDRSLALEELYEELNSLKRYVNRRNLPMTEKPLLPDAASVRATLASLIGNGVVSCFSEGAEEVFSIASGEAHTAAYYRNTIIHFFVVRSIAELALLKTASDPRGDPLATFWEETFRLRDTVKFEFFFAQREGYRRDVLNELKLWDNDPEKKIATGQAAARALLERINPLLSSRVLRSFLEAYLVVAACLERLPTKEGEEDAPFDRGAFLKTCLAVGKQYLLQKRILHDESVSQMHFRNGLKLAENRGLLEAGPPDLKERREAFAAELREIVRWLDAIDGLSASRRAGLLD
jgi:glycerol-3-phosphate O-acyltransferase